MGGSPTFRFTGDGGGPLRVSGCGASIHRDGVGGPSETGPDERGGSSVLQTSTVSYDDPESLTVEEFPCPCPDQVDRDTGPGRVQSPTQSWFGLRTCPKGVGPKTGTSLVRREETLFSIQSGDRGVGPTSPSRTKLW